MPPNSVEGEVTTNIISIVAESSMVGSTMSDYNQSGFRLDPNHSILHLSKTGDIKIDPLRAIEGTIKAVVIKRSGNQWYTVFQVDQGP